MGGARLGRGGGGLLFLVQYSFLLPNRIFVRNNPAQGQMLDSSVQDLGEQIDVQVGA